LAKIEKIGIIYYPRGEEKKEEAIIEKEVEKLKKGGRKK